VVVTQGDICWADLPPPTGSGPGYRRPVVVIQGDRFNRSKLNTAVCVLLTSELRRAESPGNLLLKKDLTGLPRDSVANVTQVMTVDQSLLLERTGTLPHQLVDLIIAGVLQVLGR
jgi:mRNA interferase MazF